MFDKQYMEKTDRWSDTEHWKEEAAYVALMCGGSVLDVGCNTGKFLQMLREDHTVKIDSLSGMDINDEALTVARAALPTAEFVDDLQLIASSSKNVVVSMHSLPQMENLTETLVQIKRILKRNGMFVVVVHNPRFRRFRLWIQMLLGKYDPDGTIINQWWSLDDLEEFMWNRGFRTFASTEFGQSEFGVSPRFVWVGEKK